MSSLSAVFNSCSTLITMDFYKKIRPGASDRQLIHVGRIATFVLVGLGLLWIPLMKVISGTLYLYLQSVQSYIAPPIAAVFLAGVFSKRMTATAAITGMVGGFGVGMLRLLAELNKDSLDGALIWFASINFLHFAALLFWFCIIIIIIIIIMMVIVSRFTKSPSDEQLSGLTFQTTTADQAASSRRTWSAVDVALSVILVAIVAAVMLYFTG